MGTKLSPLDFKFNFFPWFKCPDYAIDARGVVIEDAYKRYFDKLRDTQGIELTPAQKRLVCEESGNATLRHEARISLDARGSVRGIA